MGLGVWALAGFGLSGLRIFLEYSKGFLLGCHTSSFNVSSGHEQGCGFRA